jgi:hypothetical protein
MIWRYEMQNKFWTEKLKVTGHFKDTGVGQGIIFKWILKTLYVGVD